MNISDLARLVESMRKAQNEYFRQRDNTRLNISKDWERKVDKAVKDVLHPESPGLFDGDANEDAP